MAGTFSRSWQLIKETWLVLSKDKELIFFPVISGLAVLVIIASFILPLIFTGLPDGAVGPVIWVILLFVFYFFAYFIVILFNSGLIACAHIRLSGGDPTVGDGLHYAAGHAGQIFLWAAISATIGLVLSVIRNRGGAAGLLAAGIAGTAWSLVTFFVIPVMIFEEKGVLTAIKNSTSLFKKTWGENIIGSIGIGLVMIPVLLAFFAVFAAIITASSLLFPLIILLVVLIGVCGVVYSALRGIFVTALYIYAKTGTVPEAFSGDLIQGAFRDKGQNSVTSQGRI
jgi:hypothetical protein